jgi:hypothetical protein
MWRPVNRFGFSDNVKEEYEKQAALYFKKLSVVLKTKLSIQ